MSPFPWLPRSLACLVACLLALHHPRPDRTQGVVYFATHRALWKPLLARLGPTLGLSLGVVAAMLVVAYVRQLTVLVFVNGPLAVGTTVLLVLNESATVVSLVSRHWLLRDALLDTFDGTLVARGRGAVVAEGRQLRAGGDPIQKLGRILKSPVAGLSPKALLRYVMYLPLNFIPGGFAPPPTSAWSCC